MASGFFVCLFVCLFVCFFFKLIKLCTLDIGEEFFKGQTVYLNDILSHDLSNCFRFRYWYNIGCDMYI